MQSVQASDPGQGVQRRRVGSALGVKGRSHQALDKGPPRLGSCLHRAAPWFSYIHRSAPESPCLCAHSRDCLQCLSSLPCHFSPVQPRAPILSYPLEFILSTSFSRKSAQMSSWLQGPTVSMVPDCACMHTHVHTHAHKGMKIHLYQSHCPGVSHLSSPQVTMGGAVTDTAHPWCQVYPRY